MLYISLVGCHFEYANSVRNLYRQRLIRDLEKLQMRATKLVLTVKHLCELSYQRRNADVQKVTMIEVHKILTGYTHYQRYFHCFKHQDCRIMGHKNCLAIGTVPL